jgi:RNA polymerase sigma-70 factor (ECF subfamily)
MMSGVAEQDEQMVRRLRARLPAAFEELIDTYQGPIYGFVYRLLDDPSEASDVTQEVFLKVFRKIESFRGESSLKTWIYRIAIHEASNRRRWCARHKGNETAVDPSQEQGPNWRNFVDGDTPFEALHRREQAEALERAMRSLDDRLRVAVVLRDIQGLSYNEIAETLEISLGTVKSRILRGREALKAGLQRPQPLAAPRGAALQTE